MALTFEQEVRAELTACHEEAIEIENNTMLKPVYVDDPISGEKVEVTPAYLNKIIAGLAKKIVKDFAGRSVLFLGLMDGANFFANKLIEEIVAINATLPKKEQVRVNYTTTMTSSYEGTKRGKLTIGKLKVEVGNLTVMILDDVLDSGKTLLGVIEALLKLGAAEVFSGVLFTKEVPKRTNEATYSGLNAGKSFLVGAGMDLITPTFRLLPTIKEVDPETLPEDGVIERLKAKMKALNADLREIMAAKDNQKLINTRINGLKASECGAILMPKKRPLDSSKPTLVNDLAEEEDFYFGS